LETIVMVPFLMLILVINALPNCVPLTDMGKSISQCLKTGQAGCQEALTISDLLCWFQYIVSLPEKISELQNVSTGIQGQLTDLLAETEGLQDLKDELGLVSEIQNVTTGIQGQLTDLNAETEGLQDELGDVKKEVDGMDVRLHVLENTTSNPSLYATYTDNTIVIPANTCSWVQVYVDVSGSRKDGHGAYYVYGILLQDGAPVYGGTKDCTWDNSASTSLYGSKGGGKGHRWTYGGSTSRMFALSVKAAGTTLELKKCAKGYYSPETRMTVMCYP